VLGPYVSDFVVEGEPAWKTGGDGLGDRVLVLLVVEVSVILIAGRIVWRRRDFWETSRRASVRVD